MKRMPHDPTSDIRDTLPDFNTELLAAEPLARSETIPSSWYIHPAFHSFERRAVFENTWQYIGPAADVREPGSYVTEDVAGQPVIVVRSGDGTLRAFYNVCRHRGGPLAMDRCGAATMLQCKYHGWTYRLDGSLRGVPRFDRTELFDKRDFGLVQVALREWEGMLFACLHPERGPDFDDVFGGITGRIAPLSMAACTFQERVVYEVAANWKVYVDNYLEGYHIPLVHPELCDLLDFRAYETNVFEHGSLQSSPFKEGDNIYGNGEGEAFYYHLFPNIMLNILPGRVQVNRVDAVSADSCRVVFDYYYADTQSDEARNRIREDLAFSDKVQAEDADICAHVQRGLSSNGYDRGRFSVDMEAGVHHFQSILKRSYAAFREIGK